MTITEMIKMEKTNGIIVFIVGVLLLMVLSFISPLMSDADRLIGLLLPIAIILVGGCLLFVKTNEKPSDDEQVYSWMAYTNRDMK